MSSSRPRNTIVNNDLSRPSADPEGGGGAGDPDPPWRIIKI